MQSKIPWYNKKISCNYHADSESENVAYDAAKSMLYDAKDGDDDYSNIGGNVNEGLNDNWCETKVEFNEKHGGSWNVSRSQSYKNCQLIETIVEWKLHKVEAIVRTGGTDKWDHDFMNSWFTQTPKTSKKTIWILAEEWG